MKLKPGHLPSHLCMNECRIITHISGFEGLLGHEFDVYTHFLHVFSCHCYVYLCELFESPNDMNFHIAGIVSYT